MPSHDDYSDKSMPMFSEGSSESGELGVLLVDGSHLLVGSRSSHHHHHRHHHHHSSWRLVAQFQNDNDQPNENLSGMQFSNWVSQTSACERNSAGKRKNIFSNLKYLWRSASEQDKSVCLVKGKSEASCQNYIKVIMISRNQILWLWTLNTPWPPSRRRC